MLALVDSSIAGTAQALTSALARGDAAGAAALYTRDARLLVPSAGVISGRDAIEAYWRTGIDLGVSRLELEATEIRENGGLAIEIGNYSIHAGVVDRGTYLVLHRRRGTTQWRRAVEVFTPDEPNAARATRKEMPCSRASASPT